MDKDDVSIEKRSPGLIASLLGEEDRTVLVNKDGVEVAEIKTEEPSLFGSLLGDEPKQVIVDSDGEKVASFEKEEPGLIGRLFGEEERDVIVDSQTGDKLASFGKSDVGLLGTLLGEKPKTTLVGGDNEDQVLATFDKEQPGFIGRIFGEKPKRILRPTKAGIDEIKGRNQPNGSTSIGEVGSWTATSRSYPSSETSEPSKGDGSGTGIGLLIIIGFVVVLWLSSQTDTHKRVETPDPNSAKHETYSSTSVWSTFKGEAGSDKTFFSFQAWQNECNMVLACIIAHMNQWC